MRAALPLQPLFHDDGAARAFVNGQMVGDQRLLRSFPVFQFEDDRTRFAACTQLPGASAAVPGRAQSLLETFGEKAENIK